MADAEKTTMKGVCNAIKSSCTKENWKNALIESCGAFTIAVVVIMSTTRWPTIGGLIYGLTVFYTTSMYKDRTFNPILNLLYRPWFEPDLHAKDPAEKVVIVIFDFVSNVIGSALGCVIFWGLMHGDKDNHFLGFLYKYKADSPGMANTTYTKTVDNAATGKLPGNFKANPDFSIDNSDMYARAAVGEVIGFMIIVAALLEMRMVQKELIEKGKYDKEKESFKTKRAIHLGIAFTIASYSLGQFSGGVFNAVLDIFMQILTRHDADWNGAAWTGLITFLYLLLPFGILYLFGPLNCGNQKWYPINDPGNTKESKAEVIYNPLPVTVTDEVKGSAAAAARGKLSRSDNWDL